LKKRAAGSKEQPDVQRGELFAVKLIERFDPEG
jgi:hypothetical protein